ncbi:MAG: penicillin-binding protein activator LpoB [Deltaproteobacteria bacterium]|nr:penicillin-binding protein activator LpoB [Deltaproteobacteria bacterium]
MNKNRKNISLTLLVMLCLALLVMSGCGGPSVGRVQGAGDTHYGNADEVETVNSAWGSTDLQMTAESMTQSLLASRWIAKAYEPPKIRLREVRNLTAEHIDTKAITDKIRVQLLRSGQVRFLADTANLDEVFAEREFSEAVTRRDVNKLLADTDYIVTGTVRSIRKTTKEVADVYYQITLELVDPQSAEILWADEKEIRKSTTTPKIGW